MKKAYMTYRIPLGELFFLHHWKLRRREGGRVGCLNKETVIENFPNLGIELYTQVHEANWSSPNFNTK